ncbi:MAG TPA: glycoside hydrolase family 88 protein [Terracidiphilus sp.]|nr:glycoside hydrolase family 88 protein [Terracidiphilus sp.]
MATHSIKQQPDPYVSAMPVTRRRAARPAGVALRLCATFTTSPKPIRCPCLLFRRSTGYIGTHCRLTANYAFGLREPAGIRDTAPAQNGFHVKNLRHPAILLVAGLVFAPLLARPGSAPQPRSTRQPCSQRMAASAIARWPDGRFAPAGARWVWNYELGTFLEGIDAVWAQTEDPRFFAYIKKSVDQFVRPDGSIATYVPQEHQLDSILLGRQLILLYRVTHDARYSKAAAFLYGQLQQQPRNPDGGFWHKQIYPSQMWLDGLYMAEPFYAEYAATFSHPEAFRDITRQFQLMYEHGRDPKTGLLYHGWDQSKQQHWANSATGDSSQFWARGMGWYMMALVDTIPNYPRNDPGRQKLIEQLRRLAPAIARVQDPKSGLWWEVLNQGGEKGNYLEASASCMFVYALVRGVRLGYLPSAYLNNARHGYAGILSYFVQTAPGGEVTLTGTVKSAGLGGRPYRSGTYAYYVGEKTATNDPKGIGAFLLASSEMEALKAEKPERPDPDSVTPRLIQSLKTAPPGGSTSTSGH